MHPKKLFSINLRSIKAKVVIFVVISVSALVVQFVFNSYMSSKIDREMRMGDQGFKISLNLIQIAESQSGYVRTGNAEMLFVLDKSGEEVTKNLEAAKKMVVDAETKELIDQIQSQVEKNTASFNKAADNTSLMVARLNDVVLDSYKLEAAIRSISSVVQSTESLQDVSRLLVQAKLQIEILSLLGTLKSSVINTQELMITSNHDRFVEMNAKATKDINERISTINGILSSFGDSAVSASWNDTVKAIGTFMSVKEEFTSKWKDFSGFLPKISETNQAAERLSMALSKATRENAEKTTERGRIISIAVIAIMAGLLSVFGGFLVSGIVKPLTRAIRSLHLAITGVTETANTVVDASRSLDSAAVQQSASVQETAASITQMKAMLIETSNQASQSQAMAQMIVKSTEEGVAVVEDLVESMSSIQEANSQLAKISSAIKEIHAKTRVINDIVFKTQILSFNASIEAARAGEHGRGFAVVAEEVGSLAHMSGKAASEIFSIVDTSKDQVAKIVQITGERVGRGHEVTGKVSDIFQQIAQKVSSIFDQVHGVSTAAKEQQRGIEQVGNAMQQIENATRSSQTASVDISNQSTQMEEQSKALAGTATELEVLAFGNKTLSDSDGQPPQNLDDPVLDLPDAKKEAAAQAA